jgi:hypothetical protein
MASSSLKEETGLKTVNFNGQNFPVWKFSVFLRLKERDLAPIVEGNKLKPAATDTNAADVTKWIKDDILAQRFLFDTCNEEQQQSLLTCESSNAMWLSITSQYQQGTAERRQSLNQAFLNYKFKADHSVRTHIEAIKLLAKNYKDAGGQTTEDEIINRILTSLPPSYDNFIAPWESTAKAERTLANLTTRLCSQEERTNLRSGRHSRMPPPDLFPRFTTSNFFPFLGGVRQFFIRQIIRR